MPGRSLPGLAVPGVAPAPLAVLAQRDAIRVVALGLLGLVVPALALLAGEGHSDPDVSAGHDGVLRESWFVTKENPAPARGRQRRIALRAKRASAEVQRQLVGYAAPAGGVVAAQL